MATDSHERDSHRKHRRSVSDDEAEKPSKRHKHRHHRHRHHHRSRKLEEEKETGGDDTTPRVPAFPVATNGGQIDNDDVEEGEILDEENSEMKKLGSGEVDAVASRNGAETRYLGISEMDVMKEDAGKSTDENFVTDSITSNKMHDKNYVNGSLHREDREDDSWKRESESRSPSKRSGRSKTCMDRSEGKLSDRRKSLSSESSGDMHKRTVYSPSRDKIHSRSRSRSPDPARERSRSRSVIEDDAYLRRRHHSERHSSRDFVMEDGREDSTGYSSRYSVRGERHRSREIQHRETSREREIEREERRRIERESSKYAGIYRDYRRDNEREKSKDRETYRGREERDRSRYGEGDGGRAWEKERGRSRDRGRMSDRDIDRKRERERDRDRVRDRESERRSDRVRDKGRDNERERKKYVNPDDVYDNRDRHKHSRILTNDDKDHYRDRKRKNESAKAHGSDSYSWEGGEDKRSRDEEDEQLEFEEKVALQLVDQEEEELKRIKEESRKRRQAILEKYKNQQLQQQNESRSADAGDDKKHIEHHGPSTGADNNHLDNRDAKGQDGDFDAADQLQSVKKLPSHDAIAAFDRAAGAGGLGEGSPKSETSDHIFCDDIFGETPTGVRKSGKAEGLKIVRSGLHDNWDDAEGYYSYRFGETLDGRYEVIATHGKGVFSTVVRAKDLKAGHGEPEEVAIKIIRNNETMNKAGQTEVQILKKLAGADPENKRHCVRFISSFKYRNHLCLVFESLNMNLREVLKKFGRNIGLKLTAVRAYAKQLFISLKHLRNCGVLHCDIKPDNMLVNEAKNVLKLCDFGNAMFAGKNEITPYLVSRFYRAPEIILGLPYDHPLDIWSVGCCLYELFTGKVLFPGATNNDMLRLHMELKGSFPKKMLRKGAFTDQHFDQDLNFHATEEDPVTKKTIKRIIVNIKPKDIGSIVKNSAGEDPKMLANFKDLLEKIFVLDPEKRMTVAQALTHPFISGK